MVIDRERLRPSAARARALGTMDEWRAVADGSAEMMRQELEYDPRRGSPISTPASAR